MKPQTQQRNNGGNRPGLIKGFSRTIDDARRLHGHAAKLVAFHDPAGAAGRL